MRDPIRFKTDNPVVSGEHVTFQVRAGRNPGSLALCGELTMRKDEFRRFHALITEAGPLRAEAGSAIDDLRRYAVE